MHSTRRRGCAVELGLLAQWNLMMGLDVLARRHQLEPSALDPAIAPLVAPVLMLIPSALSFETVLLVKRTAQVQVYPRHTQHATPGRRR